MSNNPYQELPPPGNDNRRIITYVPQYSQDNHRPPSDMGTLRRGLWLYTNKLGLNFSLVLALALGYQAFVAIFLGLTAIYRLPLTPWLPQDQPVWQIVAYLLALLAGFLMQAVLVAELAQVVWLRRTDRLNVRLMADSIWWWILLCVLIITIIFDFLLMFMAVTGTTDLGQGWQKANRSQMTFIADAMLTVLNLLSLIRCASVMRISTIEENRREVEERMQTIAEEILLEAGDATRQQARKVWATMNTDARQFLPLQASVINLIRTNHPEILPPQLGGDTWGYDFGGNTFTALPPDLHLALLQGRSKRRRFSDDTQRELWSMPPNQLAQAIALNMQSNGQPRFINMADPDKPEYIFDPANFKALTAGNPLVKPGKAYQTAPDPLRTRFDTTDEFLLALPPLDKVNFAVHLKQNFEKLSRGGHWTENSGVTIWDCFDPLELQVYYRQWAGAQRV